MKWIVEELMKKDKKNISNRFFVKIICKYKDDIANTQKNKEKTENEIQIILKDFEQKTGHEVDEITITKKGNQYQLKLGIR